MNSAEYALTPGQLVDDYLIGDVLGVGGFGITYKATDQVLGRTVALKEYFPRALASRGGDGTTITAKRREQLDWFEYGLGKFLEEARTLARFNHPNIVRVNRYVESNGTGYLAMEYERGLTLDKVVGRMGRLTERQAFALAVHVLRGLSVIHKDNYLHRDIKPANILIRRSGPPVLLDFGAARNAFRSQSNQMTVMFTPGYAPLEQYFDDEPQGPWSDLYALGATLYFCLVGVSPPAALWRASSQEEGRGDDIEKGMGQIAELVSPDFAKLIRWTLSTNPNHRPSGADELLKEFLALRNHAGHGEPDTRLFGATAPLDANLRTRPQIGAGPIAAARSNADVSDGPIRAAREATPTKPSRSTQTLLTPEIEVLLERAVADFLGPIAKILVQRAIGDCVRAGASDCETVLDDVIDGLSLEFESFDERQDFLRSVHRQIEGLKRRSH